MTLTGEADEAGTAGSAVETGAAGVGGAATGLIASTEGDAVAGAISAECAGPAARVTSAAARPAASAAARTPFKRFRSSDPSDFRAHMLMSFVPTGRLSSGPDRPNVHNERRYRLDDAAMRERDGAKGPHIGGRPLASGVGGLKKRA